MFAPNSSTLWLEIPVRHRGPFYCPSLMLFATLSGIGFIQFVRLFKRMGMAREPGLLLALLSGIAVAYAAIWFIWFVLVWVFHKSEQKEELRNRK